jgi:Protease subunit of ATP-dependent Clp proteases
MKVEVKGYIVSNEDKEIYDYFGIGTTSPSDISTAIEQAAGKSLDVEISTCYGGSIFAGSQMYASLKNYTGGVHITITALAASAASIVAMAGPCEMSPTAMMMVHHVSNSAEGNFHDMDKNSEMLQQADKAMAAAYTTKSGMSETDALAMMDSEVWLTAQQAVEKGLVDKVMFDDSAQLVNACGGSMLPRSVIEKTRNMLHPVVPNTDVAEIETLKAKLALQIAL